MYSRPQSAILNTVITPYLAFRMAPHTPSWRLVLRPDTSGVASSARAGPGTDAIVLNAGTQQRGRVLARRRLAVRGTPEYFSAQENKSSNTQAVQHRRVIKPSHFTVGGLPDIFIYLYESSLTKAKGVLWADIGFYRKKIVCVYSLPCLGASSLPRYSCGSSTGRAEDAPGTWAIVSAPLRRRRSEDISVVVFFLRVDLLVTLVRREPAVVSRLWV